MRKEGFSHKVLDIRRVAKKTEGGDRFHFTALVAVGDKKGRVGLGKGKALRLRQAIEKGERRAKENMMEVPREEGTIPFEIKVKRKGARLILRPSSSGLAAGGVVRSIARLAGIENLSAKILGSRNKTTNAYAMMEGLRRMAKLAKG